MKIRHILTTMAIALLLIGCGSGYPDSTKVPVKYMPKVNPHPKYFMTVKGFIDPRLQQRIHLTIVAEYNNYNPKCNLLISHFEGASSPWQIFYNYPINLNSKSSYQIKIPLYYYQPGKCRWHIANISYVIKGKNNLNDNNLIGSFFKNMYSTKKNEDVPVNIK